MNYLPSFCPDHPNEQVEVKWDIFPKETPKRYFCVKCGIELCSDKEFQKRCERQADLERMIK
jgi:hypothetical protein